jgi:hypothetical protein
MVFPIAIHTGSSRCPAYQSVRETFRGSLPLTAITPLAELLNCQQQGILARFLVQYQTVRSELLY